MENEATPKVEKQIVYRSPDKGLLRVYSNNVQMATTSFDVRLIFGEVVELLPDKAIVEQNVQVTMSWLEAKVLADFLQANIKALEDLNGPFKLPKNIDKIVVPDTFVMNK